jgi:PAS domain S-box-containing protein
MKFHRPLPREKEIKLNSKEFLVSKTDKFGNILYVNEYFTKISGYSDTEVIGQPHNILRHPDMPAAIFFLMWSQLQSGKNITALVKNLSKTGEYYWVTTEFEIHNDLIKKDKTYIAFRRAASSKVISEIEPLYEHLLSIEKKHGMENSLHYLQGYLEERHITFNEYMDKLVKPQGLMALIFNKMKTTVSHVA